MAININNINDRLRKIYGDNPYKQPMFRIVFSDRELEKRRGTFVDWYGALYIREYVGIREVPKYAYLKGAYVLERWLAPMSCYEIDTSMGTFEPVYVFQDAEGKPLPVIEDFAHKVIEKIFNPLLPGHRTSQLKTQEEEAYRKEIEYNMLVIGDAGSAFAGKLKGGEAIIRP
jgi:hypothetical protein